MANKSFARELGASFGISGANDNVNFSGDLNTNSANRNSQVDPSIANRTALNQYYSELAAYNANPTGAPPVAPILRARPLPRVDDQSPGTLAGAGSLALSILNGGYLLDVELQPCRPRAGAR